MLRGRGCGCRRKVSTPTDPRQQLPKISYLHIVMNLTETLVMTRRWAIRHPPTQEAWIWMAGNTVSPPWGAKAEAEVLENCDSGHYAALCTGKVSTAWPYRRASAEMVVLCRTQTKGGRRQRIQVGEYVNVGGGYVASFSWRQ